MVGFLVAAPSSGAGKTIVTTGIVAALVARGLRLTPAKVGPDYIDPTFLSAAAGVPALNLDLWAMRPRLLAHLASRDALVVEGVMGLFDGPASGEGSSADLARRLGLPVVLVVDAARQSHSVAALVHGFATFDPAVRLAGVILNRVASSRHEAMLRQALGRTAVPCLGALMRDERLALPSRHLGLTPASEHADISARIAQIGALVAAAVDLEALMELAPAQRQEGTAPAPLPPPGSRIAIAEDAAFGFTYEHVRAGWRRGGATLHPFSPLADEPPDAAADAVVLPGGYPELHAGRLAGAARWRTGMRRAAERGALIYGECGGYMALGERLVDASGEAHQMAGLLPVTTSFARRRRTLGYRRLAHDGALLPRRLTGHEFHYATAHAEGAPLFQSEDATGASSGPLGTRVGRVAGSFAHVIDLAEDGANPTSQPISAN